jgi:ferredoxin--NADP+ reductase
MSEVAEREIFLPEVKMHLYRPSEPVVARVTKSEVCTARAKAAGFVRHVEIDVSGTSLVNNVFAGQSIGVLAPGIDDKGRPHQVRLYSVASPTGGETGDGTIISTTVKRTVDEHWENHGLFLGVCSNYLCNLQVGDEVKLSGPNGKKFLLPAAPEQHDYLFFATGTGIAPFRGMLLDLLRNKVNSRVTLVMGSPYATDLLYHDTFTKLAAEHRNFTYLTAISRELQADGPSPGAHHGPMYVQDRITSNRDALLPLLASERTLIYVCGIAGMELGIFQHMARHLPRPTLEQYLHVEPEAMTDIGAWNRKMLHRQIKVSKRVFLEVYA